MSEQSDDKRLIRPMNGRLVAGVCAGLAEYFGIDATIVRLIFAAVAVVTGGVGALLYLAAWVLIPEEGEKVSIAEKLVNSKRGS